MNERKALESFARKAALLACALLAGCGTVRTVQVRVPVPVACLEAEPARPVFPTESLAPGAPPFILLRAALAEIDRREGWSVELLAALRACTAPLK